MVDSGRRIQGLKGIGNIDVYLKILFDFKISFDQLPRDMQHEQ